MATITPEIKMLIILCYFIVYTAVLSTLIVESVQYSGPIAEGIFAYILCQISGENPNCDKLQMQFRQYLRPELASTTFLMIGFINWVYLIFAIHYKDMEYIILRLSTRIYHLYKAITDTTSTNKSDRSV